MKNRFSIILVLVLSLMLSGQWLRAAEQDSLISVSNEQLVELGLYEKQLEDLEYEFGPFDYSLLEPLESIVSLYIEMGDFDQAATIQNRQLRLLRTSLGFLHPDLIPAVEKIIVNQIRLGNWEAVTDHLDHLRHLKGANSEYGTEDLLLAMEDQAHWYQMRVLLDESGSRAHNHLEARDLYREIEDLAEEEYGEDSTAMYPIHYQQALGDYRLVRFLNADGGLGYDTVEQIARTEGRYKLDSFPRGYTNVDQILGVGSVVPVVEFGDLVGEQYFRDARSSVDRIRRIAEEQGDKEALAMAEIYYGDFLLLMKQNSGMSHYRDAQQMLLDSGISKSQIEKFFQQPTIIPKQKFYPRFADALAHQQQAQLPEKEIKSDTQHLGVFIAWQKSVPQTQLPESDNPLWDLDLSYDFVDLEFDLNSRGRASSVKVLDTSVDDKSRVDSRARNALRDIQFRPSFVAGESPELSDVQIRYLILSE